MDRKKVLEELYDQYTKKEEQIMPRQTEKKETPFWPWILVWAGAIGLVGFAAAPEDFGNLFLILVYRLLTTAGLIGVCMLIIPLFEQKSAKKQVNHIRSELWLKAIGELLREDLGEYRAVHIERNRYGYSYHMFGDGIAWDHSDRKLMILRAKEYSDSGDGSYLEFDGIVLCVRFSSRTYGFKDVDRKITEKTLQEEWEKTSGIGEEWRLRLRWQFIKDQRWYTIVFDRLKPEKMDIDSFETWYKACLRTEELLKWMLEKYHKTVEEA